MVSVQRNTGLGRQNERPFGVIDLRNTSAFPNLGHRFSRLLESSDKVVLERDWLGENPLHYYADTQERELVVGNNISDIKEHLESNCREFAWDRVRAVSNNSRVAFDAGSFSRISPKEEEILPTLQELGSGVDGEDMSIAGRRIRDLLEQSVENRIYSVSEESVGILLSGGLDSMSVAYVLSKSGCGKDLAFTLKVSDSDKDVVRSREVASDFGLTLAEVRISRDSSGISIGIQKYSPARKLIDEREIEIGIDIADVVFQALRVSGNPKKDNVFCAIAMYLIGKAISAEGIRTVFCGEGPNEMINDYGFEPRKFGYDRDDKGNVDFRKALTFGYKKNDLQLGRGGLPKHAIARMGKIFAAYGIRLESPYFDMEIARIMTEIPHVASYDRIKQVIMKEVFRGERIERFIEGTTKEKFQDGSGISGLFGDFGQKRLLEIFEGMYGIRKTGYTE